MAGLAAPAAPGPPRTRLLKGLEWKAVLEAVWAALDPADADLFGAIHAHVEERARTPRTNSRGDGPERDGQGNVLFEVHHFVYWLWGLEEGSWALPEPIPRAVLEGFRGLYGRVAWRCEDCRTALANGRRYAACPACGSHRSLKGLGPGGPGPAGWPRPWPAG